MKKNATEKYMISAVTKGALDASGKIPATTPLPPPKTLNQRHGPVKVSASRAIRSPPIHPSRS